METTWNCVQGNVLESLGHTNIFIHRDEWMTRYENEVGRRRERGRRGKGIMIGQWTTTIYAFNIWTT